jgi:isocitrate/isopropylmalate dehydrogenase
MKIAVLPGDGIGIEIVAEAVKVLQALDLRLETETALVGGAAFEAHGHPLPESTLNLAKAADAILFGAVGDWKYDRLERALRPEQAILGLRKHLGLFANFRPAICYAQLTQASSLKPELVAGLDILIIRELTGDIYFGQPRGRRSAPDGHFPGAEEAFDTMRYSHPEIERIAHLAFQAARRRNGGQGGKVTSVDKANVLETFQFWKRRGDRGAQGLPRRRAGPHVRGQRGHAAGARAQEVRRGRHRQHVRRHPVRRGRHAHGLHWHAALGQPEFAATRACTSPAMAAPRTSPARALPILWLQYCPLP